MRSALLMSAKFPPRSRDGRCCVRLPWCVASHLGRSEAARLDRCDYKPHSRTNPANSHSLFLTQDCPRPVFQPSQNYRLLFLPLPPLGFPVEPLQIAAGLAGNNFDLLSSRHRSPMKVSDSLWDRINFIT